MVRQEGVMLHFAAESSYYYTHFCCNTGLYLLGNLGIYVAIHLSGKQLVPASIRFGTIFWSGTSLDVPGMMKLPFATIYVLSRVSHFD